MTRECEECGATLDPDRDKAGGRYRETCLPCLEERAADISTHVETCDDDECPVCRDHHEDPHK